MRKILTALLLAASMAFLSSCEGEPGRDGRDGLGVMDVVLINVTQASWSYSNANDNNYFYATVDVPELTGDAFDYGAVKMYRTFNYDKSDAVQMEMPYIRLNEYNTGYRDESGKDIWGFYTETVDYEFGIGYIRIFYTASDFDYELNESFVPEAMQFRCVVMY